MKLIPVISPIGQFMNPYAIVTANPVFYGGETCTDRAEVITTDGKHFVVSLRAIGQSGLFDEPSTNQSPASSGVSSVGFKSTDNVETELRARYDAADKECSILRARVEEVERINLGLLTQLDDRSRDIASLRTQKDELLHMNLTQSGRIKEMMEHGVNTVYKPDFDRAIVQRDAAREELKHALDECQLMRQAIVVNRGDINRLTLEREEAITRIKHVSLQRDDHRRVADAYKARLDQIQGIVNP